jgi:hypothetical protein
VSLTFYLFWMVLFIGLVAAGIFFYVSRGDDGPEE